MSSPSSDPVSADRREPPMAQVVATLLLVPPTGGLAARRDVETQLAATGLAPDAARAAIVSAMAHALLADARPGHARVSEGPPPNATGRR